MRLNEGNPMPTDIDLATLMHLRASSSEEARFVVPGERMVNTLDDADAVVRSLQAQITELARQLRIVQKQLDTHGSPWWKRILFRIDGWPAWWIIARDPDWRPWRRWWRS